MKSKLSVIDYAYRPNVYATPFDVTNDSMKKWLPNGPPPKLPYLFILALKENHLHRREQYCFAVDTS